MAEGHPHSEAELLAAGPTEIYCQVHSNERLFEGQLIERVTEWVPAYDEASHEAVAGIQPRVHLLALVVSQDCDLEQDFGKRQQNPWAETDLRSVLLCPAFPADELRKQQNLTSRKWETVRQNKDDRYAYLAEVPQPLDAAGAGHPAILLDLMNYFTVRTPELYRQLRNSQARARCRLTIPWREHMQFRFAAFLARIGLPRDHFVPESRRPQLPPPEASPG
ncbi:MAG: hypothetical protein ABSH20_10580 [Tepidisphaeraceae bacterium]